MIKITTINENILKSYLTDFRDKYVQNDKEEFDNFINEFLQLYKKDQKLSNDIKTLKTTQKDLTNYVIELKNKLSNSIIQNQLLLEQYTNYKNENDILDKINNNLLSKNSNKTENITRYQNDIQNYDNKIVQLEKDIKYYKNILENLSLITNIIDNDSYKIDETFKTPDIITSPYYRLISQSNKFDYDYYRRKYLNKNKNTDAIKHFIEIGAKLDYNPNTTFNTKWYRKVYLKSDKNINPFIEYLEYGIKENRLTQPPYNKAENIDITDSHEYLLINESEYFNKDYYRNKYKLDEDTDVTRYYLKNYKETPQPSEEFDTEWYNKTYLKYTDVNPLLDYITHYDTRYISKVPNPYMTQEDTPIEQTQLYNIINESKLMDNNYYDKYNKDNTDNIIHFITKGFKQGYKLNKTIENEQNNDIWQYLFDNTEYDEKFDYTNIPEACIEQTREYQILSDDELFDKEYYLRTNNDVKNAGIDPIRHYITNGYVEGRNPSENFNTNSYINKHPNYISNPLVDYILNDKTDYNTSKDEYTIGIQDLQEYAIIDSPDFFDRQYYLRVNADVKNSNIDPLEHFIRNGIKEGRNPKDNINIRYLAEQIPKDNTHKYIHYIIDVCKNAKDYSLQPTLVDEEYKRNYNILSNTKYFNKEYYIKHNPNLTDNDDVIDYYLTKGRYEEYPTSKYFSPTIYLKLNPDLKKFNIDPLIHFINSGLREQRPFKRVKLTPNDFKECKEDLYEKYSLIYDSEYFDEHYYMTHYPEVYKEDKDPIIDYILNGQKYSRNPSAIFSTDRYLKIYGDVKKTGLNPLYHYLLKGSDEDRFTFLPEEYYINRPLERYSYLQAHKIIQKLQSKITIILEYNQDINYFKNIITAILENTHLNYELIIIIDNNIESDKQISQLDNLTNIKIIKTDNTAKEINNILNQVENDIVILDKNTTVTPHWLSKLIITAYKNKQTATVSALSNQSEILSDENKKLLTGQLYLHDNHLLYDTSKKLEVILNDNHLKIKSNETSCIYIKNEVLLNIDNYINTEDLLEKLYEKGWINLKDNSVFVYTRDLRQTTEDNQELLNQIEVKRINKQINKYAQDKNIHKRRILVLTQSDEEYNVEVDEKIKRLSQKYEVYILALEHDNLYLYKLLKNKLTLIETQTTDYSYTMNYFIKTYFNILTNLKIDLVYTKFSKQLYHATNRRFTKIIELTKYLEIEEIHESLYKDLDLLEEFEYKFYNRRQFDEIIENKKQELDFSDKKVVVYTAVTGSYDKPVIPSYVNEDFDYICFTDNPNLKSDFWKIKQMEESQLDNIRRVRSYKILPHKYLSEYDYSIWIDTNFEITGDLTEYIHKYSKNNKLLAIKHESRDCIYEEAQACITSQKDSKETITQQIAEYRNNGYPEHNGLIASGILFRNHHDKQVIKVMQDWFEQLEKYSYRDQLSFNYACFINNFQYDEAKVFYLKNPYFQRHDHLKNGFLLRISDVEYEKSFDLEHKIDTIDNILESFNQKTSIIMQVSSDVESTRKAIESIIKHTKQDYQLIIINNNPDDENIKQLLQEYSENEDIQIIHNNQPRGYCENINHGINISTGDVVIVDNHIIVTSKWLEKLKVKAYSKQTIATVTPLFNKTSYYTISDDDKYITDNLETIANNIEKKSRNTTIILPASDNNCMYIKREAIYQTGFFDINFEKTNADCDYSRRLINRRWTNVLDTSTFIYHKYDEENTISKDRKLLIQQYPEYKTEEEEFKKSYDLNKLLTKIRYMFNSKNNEKKCILYAIHGGYGGTQHTSIELIKNIDDKLDAYLLITNTEKIELYKYNRQNINDTKRAEEFKQELNLLRVWKLAGGYTLLNDSIEQIRAVCFNLIMYLNVDIVHIRHIIKSSFDLPNIAGTIGIPVVLSFHDFYYVCPSHNLVDDNRQYCGGYCPPLYENSALGGQCNILGDLNIPPCRIVVHQWRDRVREMFKNISAFVTTCQSAYDIYTEFYPELKERDFRIIEHGRDIKTPDKIEYSKALGSDEKVVIALPGQNLGYTKGYMLIKQLKEVDIDDRLEFHYMGSLGGHNDLLDIGIAHGKYNRSDFNSIIHDINPRFIALLSIWPETYCHTLTEGWGSGVPIIGLDMGAIGERIKREGGGYIIDNNPQKAYRQILGYAENIKEYNRKKDEITDIKFKTTKQMADEYMQIYEKYLDY